MKRIGFYLHTSWEYAYPFAVRSWGREDFAGWFAFLRALGMNHVMIWPLTEAMPAPLSEEDSAALTAWRAVVDDAQAAGLECWLVWCANLTARPEIAAKPFKERHLYPNRIDVRLDDPAAREAYFAHRAALMAALDNADAYVTIDGDPGGYPGAQPHEFLRVMHHDRETLDARGRADAALVPWLWSGWGSDWGKNGVWQEPLPPLTRPLLEMLKQEMPEPWGLLPGRSIRAGWANGRTNFELVEEAGLTAKSTLLCYEIIEFEPTPPAVALQFDDIRRVLREEAPLLEQAQGVMGNAQQPIMALPNLFFFARGAVDPAYLDKSEEQVLADLAEFLGGPADLLTAAWQCGRLELGAIPADLAASLRASALTSPNAALLPGGARGYLEILARWVEARVGVLQACCCEPASTEAAGVAIGHAVTALVQWWNLHRYVFSGENEVEFALDFTHPTLQEPLWAFLAKHLTEANKSEAAAAAKEVLLGQGSLTPAAAERLVERICPGCNS